MLVLPEVLNALPEMFTVSTLYKPVNPETLEFVKVTLNAESASNPPLIVPPITVKLPPEYTYTFPLTVAVAVIRQTPLTGTRTFPVYVDVMDPPHVKYELGAHPTLLSCDPQAATVSGLDTALFAN